MPHPIESVHDPDKAERLLGDRPRTGAGTHATDGGVRQELGRIGAADDEQRGRGQDHKRELISGRWCCCGSSGCECALGAGLRAFLSRKYICPIYAYRVRVYAHSKKDTVGLGEAYREENGVIRHPFSAPGLDAAQNSN